LVTQAIPVDDVRMADQFDSTGTAHYAVAEVVGIVALP
jgi:hypothetical protein